MDAEQESRWAAAQGIRIGEDLIPAALRHLDFLAAVDRRRWLYEGPLLDRAIRRYKACWLPLLAKHTEAAVVDGPLVVPLDCEWIWHCHRLNPAQYVKDCKRLYGRILDNNNVESSIQAKSKDQAAKVWTELLCPGEPFELEFTSPSNDSIYESNGAAGGISYDLVSAVRRQSSFVYQVGTPSMHDRRFLEEALARYKGFLYVIKVNQDKGLKFFRVPTYDVDLIWHTHQLHPVTYYSDMLNLLGRVLEHDDTDDDRAEGKKLDTGFSGTTEQFENTFGLRYWKVGAMYRGNLPSPVTSTPQIFRTEDDNGFGIGKEEKHLTILETTVLELYLQIVDIKNLPSSIPEKSVYVWFTKSQPDLFISDGGRLDISAKTGKSIGAGFQCEPTGEIILTVMVDHAYFGASSSKKSEPLGKVSISLQELAQPDSKLSFERWFELKSQGGYAGFPTISLRVAASSTVPRRAPQVLSMIDVKPFSLKACLLPPSVKDQQMSWTRFVYDCGTELVRLQIRESKAKSGMALIRELVGVTKSSKRPFQLAEFKETKWSFIDSNLSITSDLKMSQDGCDEDRPRQLRLFSYRRILCFHNKYQVYHISIPSTFTIRNKAELLLCLNNICRHHKNNMTSAPFMNKEQLVRGLDKFTAKNKYAFFDWKELLSHVNDQVNAYTLVSLFSMTKEAELLLELNLCRPIDDEQRQLKVKMKRNSRSMLLAIDHNKKNTSRMKKRRLARCPIQQTSHEHLHISSLILLDNGTPTWTCLARLEGHTGQEIKSTFQQNKRCII